jgi:endogenous inhibitor of DNA gyrase (YacG/DUF329 family)
MEIKKEIKIVEYIEYDGIRFYRDKKGYWLSKKASRTASPVRLHIYVWEKYNGKVPKGYHVHHIDHNPDNNEIENLELVEKTEHLKYHARLQDVEWLRQNLDENARPKAIEWHKSPEGIEWHKQQYEKTKDKLHKKIIITCIVCGKEAEVGQGGAGNKFCSNNCKSMYRRKIGYDNIELNCTYCGKPYYTNKYSPAKYCSKECRVKGRYESKKN